MRIIWYYAYYFGKKWNKIIFTQCEIIYFTSSSVSVTCMLSPWSMVHFSIVFCRWSWDIHSSTISKALTCLWNLHRGLGHLFFSKISTHMCMTWENWAVEIQTESVGHIRGWRNKWWKWKELLQSGISNIYFFNVCTT